MKIYYYKTEPGNFGDDLNPWMWPKLLPKVFSGSVLYTPPKRPIVNCSDTIFLGMGTILNERIPKNPVKVVFGTGAGGNKPPKIDTKWHIYCVRGPISAKILGIDPALGISDPAVLLRTLDLPTASKVHKFSFMPNHLTHRIEGPILNKLCKNLNINYIDSSSTVDEVLKKIIQSEILITEALHGAVVADALRIPWIPVKAHNYIFDLKFLDWCNTIQLDYKPNKMIYRLWKPISNDNKINSCKNIIKNTMNTFNKPLIRRSLIKIMREEKALLSSDHVIDNVTGRLLSKLDKLKEDISNGVFGKV